MIKLQVNDHSDPMVSDDDINAYQTAISAYVTNIELWKAYARAQLELEDEKMQERINRFMERGKIWAEGGENYVAECQKKLNAYAAKMEVWTAYVRAKSEELDRAAALTFWGGGEQAAVPAGDLGGRETIAP